MNLTLLCPRLLLVLLLLTVQAGVQAGVEPTPAATATEVPAETAGRAPATHDPLAMSSLWQLTLGMLVVLGLILALAWLLKRSGRFQAAAGGGLRVLGGLSMGARERVVLIQAGETQLLLGVAPGRVQTLHVLEQPLAAGDALPGGGFAEQLARVIGRGKSA